MEIYRHKYIVTEIQTCNQINRNREKNRHRIRDKHNHRDGDKKKRLLTMCSPLQTLQSLSLGEQFTLS